MGKLINQNRILTNFPFELFWFDLLTRGEKLAFYRPNNESVKLDDVCRLVSYHTYALFKIIFCSTVCQNSATTTSWRSRNTTETTTTVSATMSSGLKSYSISFKRSTKAENWGGPTEFIKSKILSNCLRHTA
jgi:hypothetical protein